MSILMRWACILGLVGSVVGCESNTEVQSAKAIGATPAAFNTAGSPTVEFSVPDMMCPEGCGATVKEILAKQEGAKDVLVDFEAKTATVAVDQDKFDTEQALAALVDKQFANSSLKDVATAKPPLGRELGAERQAAEEAAVQ